MKWYNAGRDILPEHHEEVIICVSGVYYMTVFNRAERHFYLKEQPDTFFALDSHIIYWAPIEIHAPNSEPAVQVAQNSN